MDNDIKEMIKKVTKLLLEESAKHPFYKKVKKDVTRKQKLNSRKSSKK